MTDPVTGVSRGFGFVRFSAEADSIRALVEMQGVYVSPLDGQSAGRPLRVCPATPKNKVTPGGGGAGAGGPGPSPQDSEAMARAAHAAHLMGAGGGLPRGMPLPQGFGNASPRPDMMHSNSASNGLGIGATGHPAPAAGALGAALPQALQMLQAQAQARNAPGGGPGIDAPSGPPSGVSPGQSAAAAALTSSALDPNNTTVFVGGLSSLISEDTLRTFFVPFGEISYVKIPPGKGCGFVQFVRKADAERAIERMQGFPIGGGRIRLSWGRSQGDKAAAAAAQAAAQAAQLGHLANLAGLGGLSASQLAQLAGLSSALSAVQAGAAPVVTPHPSSSSSPLGRASELQANSALLHQLAVARAGIAGGPPTPGVTSPGLDTAAAHRAIHQQHQQQQQQQQLGQQQQQSNDQLDAELLRSVYASLASQSAQQQQRQNVPVQQQQQHQQQIHPGHPSLDHMRGPESNHPNGPKHSRPIDHLSAALAGMDLRREGGGDESHTFYQSSSSASAADQDDVSGHQSSPPSMMHPAAWYARASAEERQHRASPHSMLKASTFAPFSPADSPVVADVPLPGGDHTGLSPSSHSVQQSSQQRN